VKKEPVVSIDDDWPAMDNKFAPGEEQKFKTAMLKTKRLLHPGRTYFEVENEEKEAGFPDTIEVFENQRVVFVEYKVSDANGKITFQSKQPLFYARHKKLVIKIVAWSVPDNSYWVFNASDVVAMKSLTANIMKGYLVGGKL